MFGGFLRWLFQVPESVAKSERRFYIVAKIGYVIGGVTHFGFLILFAYLEQYVLTAFNIFSVLVFGLGYRFHIRGIMSLPYTFVGFEVLTHAVLATVYLGWAAGFQYYALIAVITVFLAPFYSVLMQSWIVLTSAATFVGLGIFTRFVPPLQPVGEGWLMFFLIANAITLVAVMLSVVVTYRVAVEQAEEALEAEYEKSEHLLHNILPVEIAERLKQDDEIIADEHREASILFADIVGFTRLSSSVTPAELVRLLNGVFSRFDGLVDRHGLEKIKTIGDAYMVVAGLPSARSDHARIIARLGLEMIEVVEREAEETGTPLEIRIGINSGPVVAGVIGRKKFAYDLWGDAVNVAARMESTGEPGRVQVSAATRELLGDDFSTETRGDVEIKGVGRVETYFLGARHEAGAAAAS